MVFEIPHMINNVTSISLSEVLVDQRVTLVDMPTCHWYLANSGSGAYNEIIAAIASEYAAALTSAIICLNSSLLVSMKKSSSREVGSLILNIICHVDVIC